LETPARRSGIKLDAARLDYELSIRGLSSRAFAERGGLLEVTLSRARHGKPVAEATLRRITEALVAIPVLAGAELIVAVPEKTKDDTASTSVSSNPPSKEALPDANLRPRV
jgi:hypothetical protein